MDAATIARYWDSVAGKYLELFREEFLAKPFDRQIIFSFAASLEPGARVCDAGCGPCGHVTRLLADSGLDPIGVDISPKCVALARQEQPSLRFEVMNMASLAFADLTFQGLVAYYALHYQSKLSLDMVIREFARVLRPQGRLLIVAKEGSGEGWIIDPLGSGQQIFWCALTAQDLQILVTDNGFAVLNCEIREPLPEEIFVRRIYLTAERVPA
jgi:ubiquinone/menaquinone biosynthesis C-methylase UbiE